MERAAYRKKRKDKRATDKSPKSARKRIARADSRALHQGTTEGVTRMSMPIGLLKKPPADLELPRASFLDVEKRLQGIRMEAMRLAVSDAAKKPSSKYAVTRGNVREGLSRLAASGLKASGGKEAVPQMDQDTYIYLEKRLHNLRREVIRWASKFATDESRSRQEAASEITAAHVESAWKALQSDPLLLRSLLVSEGDTIA